MIRIIRIALASALVALTGQTASAMDVPGFTRLAQDTIRQMNMGVAGDIDALIADQEAMIEKGIEGISEFIEQNPEYGPLLRLVANNAEAMKEMTLDEIEAQWHEGAYLKARGHDPEKLDHFGAVVSLMDSIIHPATSYLALQEYKKTGDSTLLTRAAAELIEVVEHVAHLEPRNDIRLSSN